MKCPVWLVALMLAFVVMPGVATAHVSSDSFLVLHASGKQLVGHWDIALRDLDVVLNLDTDGDRQLRWGEVRGHAAEIASYALQGLSIANHGAPCELRAGSIMIDRHQGETFVVLPLTARCTAGVSAPGLTYRLFAGVDANHRGLLDLEVNGASFSAALEPSATPVQFLSRSDGRWQALRLFLKTGIEHIWSGYDHLLFLLSLLLPAVWRRQVPGREAHSTLRAAALDVARIVTAFTVAHSITLALATFDVVRIPPRWSESAIALSIVIAALNNLWPVVTRRLWLVAFGFGLLHGFGFANVLSDLGLPAPTLAVALLGFNLGVEVGQLAVVMAFLPIAYALRHTLFYRRVVFTGGSAAVAVVGAMWLLERAAGLPPPAQWLFR
jgi:xanthosine utilization system XapX-like protein